MRIAEFANLECGPSAMKPTEGLDRVSELLDLYSRPEIDLPGLLCDARRPSNIAYRFVDSDLAVEEMTYGALRIDSERIAAGLRSLGLRRGDRVATLMGKGRAYVTVVMAIWRLGAVHVPLFTAFASPAVALRLHSSACAAVFCDAAQKAKLRSPEVAALRPRPRIITDADVEGDEVRFCDLLSGSPPGFQAEPLAPSSPMIEIYTSGTTGPPKGVVVPVRALASMQAYVEFGLDLRPDDVFWNAADPGWAYGLYYGVLATLISGVPSLMFEGGFSPEATLEILRRFGVTNFAAAPTIYRSMRAAGLETQGLKLRCASSAGEPLTPEINAWAVDALGVSVHDHYGQTETGMVVNNHHHPALRRPLRSGSMGHAMPGWRVVVLKADDDAPADVDELGRVAIDLVSSPLAWFGGYKNDAERSQEKFSANGRWYVTGDSGRRDQDGYLYFMSREDDVIIMAGYRIGPSEVEAVLLSHPDVAECAVVAAPDEVRGEVLEAVVVLTAGRSQSDALSAELQTWVKQNYAAHAYPRQIHYVESLPRTSSGKLQRYLVRQQLGERAQV